MSTSTSLQERAVERAVERSRARWRWRLRIVLVLLLLLGLAAGAGWLLLGSGAFAVKGVQVTGVDRLTASEVTARADIPQGEPLATLDTAAVQRRVAMLAPVRRVQVIRSWPGTVLIQVTERTASAVRARGSSWELVDRTGVPFATVERRPKRLPLISAPVDQGPAALKVALDVLEGLPVAVRDQVRQVRAADAEHVSIKLTRGRSVNWGGPERSERKSAVLTALLTRKARVYDVSAPDIPTTRR